MSLTASRWRRTRCYCSTDATVHAFPARRRVRPTIPTLSTANVGPSPSCCSSSGRWACRCSSCCQCCPFGTNFVQGDRLVALRQQPFFTAHGPSSQPHQLGAWWDRHDHWEPYYRCFREVWKSNGSEHAPMAPFGRVGCYGSVRHKLTLLSIVRKRKVCSRPSRVLLSVPTSCVPGAPMRCPTMVGDVDEGNDDKSSVRW
jgi:hypothetical protein